MSYPLLVPQPPTHPLRAALALLVLAMGCVTPEPPPPEPPPVEELVFWEVRPPGGAGGRAWLLGSIHFGPDGLELDREIEAAFHIADTLVFELDLSEPPEKVQVALERLAVLPDGAKIQDVLTPETEALLRAFLTERRQPLARLQFYKPWFHITWVTALRFAESGLSPASGVDAQLLGLAGEREVVSLETFEEQLELFDAVPLPIQDRMLRSLLEDPHDAVEEAKQLYEAWTVGDLDEIERIGLAPYGEPELREFYDRTFLTRNERMAERLDALFEKPGRYFVVAGAGHMVGERGLPTLLEGRGYDVKRVRRNP